MVRNSLSMTKFKYRIISIDFLNSVVHIRYWCEGMSTFNGFTETIPFSVNTLQDMTEKEFDLKVYDYVKNDFKGLLFIYENYKNGAYDVLEKVARTVRSLDVV